MTRTRTSISVSFLDWIVQLSHKLVLTRGISIRYVPAVVSSRSLPSGFVNMQCTYFIQPCPLFCAIVAVYCR